MSLESHTLTCRTSDVEVRLKNTNNPGMSQNGKAPNWHVPQALLLLSIMSDLDNFLAEQEARMGLRDEPFEDYIARMTVAMDK